MRAADGQVRRQLMVMYEGCWWPGKKAADSQEREQLLWAWEMVADGHGKNLLVAR